MNIAIICDVLGEENNGTTIAAMTLIRYLKAQGHTVRIVCADQKKKGMEDVFVVPNLNLGKLLNRYIEKVGVSLAKADNAILAEALNGVDHVHIMLPFSLGTAVIKMAKKMALKMKDKLHCDGVNIVQNNEEAAGQTVFHFHMHVIPRYKNDGQVIGWKPGTPTAEEMDAVLEELK